MASAGSSFGAIFIATLIRTGSQDLNVSFNLNVHCETNLIFSCPNFFGEGRGNRIYSLDSKPRGSRFSKCHYYVNTKWKYGHFSSTFRQKDNISLALFARLFIPFSNQLDFSRGREVCRN